MPVFESDHGEQDGNNLISKKFTVFPLTVLDFRLRMPKNRTETA